MPFTIFAAGASMPPMPRRDLPDVPALPKKMPPTRAELQEQLAALDGKRDHFSRKERERLRREIDRRGAP